MIAFIQQLSITQMLCGLVIKISNLQHIKLFKSRFKTSDRLINVTRQTLTHKKDLPSSSFWQEVK